MKKDFRSIFTLFAVVLTFAFSAFAQETTGSIEIIAKDSTGAVVPNVAITVAASGSSAGFKRTVTTNDEGFARFLQVPPGTYAVSSAAVSGFVARTLPDVTVSLGKATVINNFELSTTVAANVTVTGDDVSAVDTSDSKIQTTISAATAELLPKGVSFSSVLKLSPATRVEPLSGGFQIDGASGSENVFVIDGQEVSNVRTGVLDATSDLPFSLVQEVQIKSSGFEAEYGGATGGVVNIVTKGGSNQWRGEFGSQFRPGALQTRGRDILVQNIIGSGGAEYYPQQRDKSLGFFPSASLGGPIVKDRLWFFGSYTPQIFSRERTINYVHPVTRQPAGVTQTYSSKSTFDYYFLRLDAQPSSKIRLSAAYTYNPYHSLGSIPSYTDAITACSNAAVTVCSLPTNGTGLTGSAYTSQVGGRQNTQSISVNGVWTPLSNLVIGARAGHYFLNEKSGSYGITDITLPRLTCSTTSIPTVGSGNPAGEFPAGFGCVRGFTNNLATVQNTVFDVTTRNTFDADATTLFSGGGRHELKGGYQYNGISNSVQTQLRPQIVLRRGYSVAQYSGVSALQSTPGFIGSGLLRIYGEIGDVSSKNEGIYIQDKWQPTRRLTLNLGVRTERENVPSFTPGAPGIKFDFQDKIAPRLGAAFDLTGDGKTKVSAFYGWFYDRFKYELPRGSFGGAYYHDFFYEILPGDTLATFTVANILGPNNPTGRIGGICPTNTTVPAYGRVRCDKDYRVPSNTDLGIEFGAIDPNIKAFRQSEMTITFERDLGRKLTFAGRFSHKNVDRTVEDAGFYTSTGSEAYVIGNPGEGLYADIATQNGLLLLKPKRTYDALELRLDRRFADNWFFNMNYTWSRLVGNYSGLASSDEDGRVSPNVNRFFDLPHAGYTVAGGPDNGVLPTDRTHAFKFYGAYNFDWDKLVKFGKGNETMLSLFTTLQSGTPITSTVDILNIDTIVLDKRGDLGRTEMYTQTDLALRHSVKFGRDNRFKVVLEADVINAFNESNELSRNNLISITNYDLTDTTWGILTAAEAGQLNAYPLAMGRFQRNGAPLLAADARLASQRISAPLFNLTNAFQGGREVRMGFRFIF